MSDGPPLIPLEETFEVRFDRFWGYVCWGMGIVIFPLSLMLLLDAKKPELLGGWVSFGFALLMGVMGFVIRCMSKTAYIRITPDALELKTTNTVIPWCDIAFAREKEPLIGQPGTSLLGITLTDEGRRRHKRKAAAAAASFLFNIVSVSDFDYVVNFTNLNMSADRVAREINRRAGSRPRTGSPAAT